MNLKTLMAVLAGAAVTTAAGWMATASANPVCVNPDGSPCNLITEEGATGAIPGGPTGTAGWNFVQGSIPFGPSGQVTADRVSGCIPNIGCIDVPRYP